MPEQVAIVETPRDAFQGLTRLIPTAEKIRYVSALLAAGVKHLDVGSFVSPKAVPQMADTRQVMEAVRGDKSVEYLALVANERGVERAADCGGFDTLGFPFSFSNEFQLRNTNKTVAETWPMVERMVALTEDHDCTFLVYVSMAFGNPYGESWDEDALLSFLKTLVRTGIRHIALSDTVAVARPEQIRQLVQRTRAEFQDVKWSVHLHGRPDDWRYGILAALDAGCRRLDGACGGLGGCPFAQDHLVSNVPTEGLVELCEAHGYECGLRKEALLLCVRLARDLQALYA